MPKVLITTPELFGGGAPCHQLLTDAGFEIVYPPPGVRLFEEDLLIKHLQGIDAMIAGMEPFTRHVLANTRLRAIARFGVGYDAIDIPAATAAGVVVAIAVGGNQHSVAEHTMALILGVFRGLALRDRQTRRQLASRHAAAPRRPDAGTRRAGTHRQGGGAPRQGMGLTVIAHDAAADAEFCRSHDVRLCSLDDLIEQSDIVSLHVPCTPQMVGLISAAQDCSHETG